MDFRIRKSIGWTAMILIAAVLSFCVLTGRFNGKWEISVQPIGQDTLVSVFWGRVTDRPRYEVILQGAGFVDSVPRSNRGSFGPSVRIIMWDETMLPGRLVIEISNTIFDVKQLSLDVYRSEQSAKDLDPIFTVSPDQRGLVAIKKGPNGQRIHNQNSTVDVDPSSAGPPER
jgi:hypothetical protein